MPDLDPIRRALSDAPDNVPLLLLFGQSCLEDWAVDEAARAFRRVIEHDRGNVEARLGLAHALILTGAGSEAVVRLEAMREESPNDARVLVLLARAYLAEGDLSEARRTFASAIEFDPGTSDPGLEKDLGFDRRRGGGHGWITTSGAVDAGASGEGLAGFDEEDGPPWEDESPFTLDDFERPAGGFETVAGLEKVKHELAMRFIHPLRHPDLFRTYGKSPGGGVLLYGPPGCGKTLLARAAAGEAGARFVAVRPHHLLDMYIGNSEKNLHQVFDLARENAPVVLLFDEVESVAADRREGRHAVPKSVTQQFLAELDAREAGNEGVLVVASTSAPWAVDAAFRRAGRFDRALFVPPPDAASRETLFRMWGQNKPMGEIDYDYLVRLSEGFAASDLLDWFERAIEDALERAMSGSTLVPLTTDAFTRVLPGIRPAAPDWFAHLRRTLADRDDPWPLGEMEG